MLRSSDGQACTARGLVPSIFSEGGLQVGEEAVDEQGALDGQWKLDAVASEEVSTFGTAAHVGGHVCAHALTPLPQDPI